MLTYNVAGLPQGISSSQPLFFQKKISPLLNDYDLVLVQEDFFYHHDLTAKLTHPHIGENGKGGTLGDGLARFSVFPFTEVDHVAWQECYGTLGHANDCLTHKGFSFARHTLAPGVTVDVYNLHMDAGSTKGDNAAKDVQVDQLIDRILEQSEGRAVLMAGDFNLKMKREPQKELIERLLSETELANSRVTLDVGEDRIDRILYRSGGGVTLTPVSYSVPDEKFSTKYGFPLSDHEPVAVVFEWQYTGE